MSRYLVKFAHEGRTVYGVAEEFSEEAEAAAKLGEAIVADAITPAVYRIKANRLVDIPIGNLVPAAESSFGLMEFDDEYHKYVDCEFKKAVRLSDSLPARVPAKGKLLSTPVGDGLAWYVITKVNKATCKVEWRGFSADRWVDHYLGYGKTAPLDFIQSHIRRFDAFSGKKKEECASA